MLSSFKEVIRVKEKISNILKQLEVNPNNEELLNEYGKLENYLVNNHGYDYEYLIDLMISRFGFSKSDYDKPISSFSGGEKSKIAFSKLLLDSPSLLILDEPTNHLDVLAKEALKEAIEEYEGTVILVCHEPDFYEGLNFRVIDAEEHSI
jgi:ATP-binding cassette subfamily F protein 3